MQFLPVKSVLDTDLYKFTMQQAVLELYPDDEVEYRFTNRQPADKFTPEFFCALQDAISQMGELRLEDKEAEFLSNIPFLKPHYIAYLKDYRFNSNEVSCELTQDQDLSISIRGPWHRTILWEVPLMATISELYFQYCDTDWSHTGQDSRILAKGQSLYEADCRWADFGTRRRRCYDTQATVVSNMTRYRPHFVGTSNVHLAQRFKVAPIGTMAHEWIMGISILEGLRHANRFALQAWKKVYKGNLGIALTDTYGSTAFWNDFDSVLARLYDGVRHDSGCPFDFAVDTVRHYTSKRIDSETKSIVFSDSLDVEKAIKLQKHCRGKIRCSFGIGTHFTNDFPGSNALNMVIKLWSINNIPVVKLGDGKGKSQGKADAVSIANHMFKGTPLRKRLSAEDWRKLRRETAEALKDYDPNDDY